MTDGNRIDRAPETTREPREPKSRAGLLAIVFVLALVGWMGSGYLQPASEPTDANETPAEKTDAFTVEAFVSTAQDVTEFVSAEGQVLPARMTPVRAKVGGTVESIAVEKGDFLEEGDLIGRIALADRTAQRVQAQAELERAQNEYDRVTSLAEQGYATTPQVESARATLRTAEAALAQVTETTGNTEIRAPITGVLDQLDLDVGQFVAASDEVGTQVDNDPLKVDVDISQQAIARIERGQPAMVRFINGETREGRVTYVAANATTATRTFPVEVRVANPDRDVPAGISAQVRIPTGSTKAHFISTALMALGPDGDLGVKTVDADSKVAFYPIDLVRAETDGIWVSGLPETVELISVGQGFVSAGEPVRVIAPENEDGGEPLIERPAGSETESLVGATDAGSPSSLFEPQDVAGEAGEDGADRVNASDGDRRSSLAEAAQRVLNTASIDMGAVGMASDVPVRLVQQRLAALGFDPGPVDGVMGASTRDALRAFQASRGLPVTGTLDLDVAGALLDGRVGGDAG